jgi:predicted methyltransferase
MNGSVTKCAVFVLCMPRLFVSAHADTPIDASSASLADPHRPREQSKLDAVRKPAQLLAFAKLKAGDQVADFMPKEQLANCSPAEVAGTKALEQDSGYTNVTVLVDAAANFTAPRKLDVLWTAQNYHDLHDLIHGPRKRRGTQQSVLQLVAAGGIFLLIDHVAQSGAGLRDKESLHHIDAAQMRKEIEPAGFVFEAQSDALRHRKDDHTLSVFDPRALKAALGMNPASLGEPKEYSHDLHGRPTG